MDHRATMGSPIPGSGQTLALGGASVPSAALTGHTRAVRLCSTGDCFVEFGGVGQTPVAAAATSMFLAAYSPEYFEVSENSIVAVIQSGAATGNLYITLF